MVAPGETSGKTGTAESELKQLSPLAETAIVETHAHLKQDSTKIQGHINGIDSESNPLVVAERVTLARGGVQIRMHNALQSRGGVHNKAILDVYANLSSSSALAAYS